MMFRYLLGTLGLAILVGCAASRPYRGRSTSASFEVGAVLATAESYLGRTYRYGGTGRRGFDCSGFVQTVFQRHGYRLPRTSELQSREGKRVGWGELRPGDLVFFSDRPGSRRVGHVGIALPGGRMIHASTGRKRIVIDDLSMKYYRQRRYTVRRVLSP